MTVHLGVNISGVWGEHTVGIPILVSTVFYSRYYYITLVSYTLQTIYGIYMPRWLVNYIVDTISITCYLLISNTYNY